MKFTKYLVTLISSSLLVLFLTELTGRYLSRLASSTVTTTKEFSLPSFNLCAKTIDSNITIPSSGPILVMTIRGKQEIEKDSSTKLNGDSCEHFTLNDTDQTKEIAQIFPDDEVIANYTYHYYTLLSLSRDRF